jgi:outer membrane immunogenic protein
MIHWFNNSVLVALFCFSARTFYGQTVNAHESQPVDVSVMFNAEHTQYTYGNNFWLYGASGESAFHVKYNIGLVVNATGTTSQGNNDGNSFSKVMTIAGPRYTLPLEHKRIRIFAEGLFGGVHAFNSVFPAINGPLPTANAFAMQLGGGCDLSLSRTWSIRLIDAHYVRTDLPNAFTDRQQDLLLGAGSVWRPIDRTAK